MINYNHLEEHNTDSLRSLVRALQEENRTLRELLAERQLHIPTSDSAPPGSDSEDFDPDQGARILSFPITEKTANKFFSVFWGRRDVYAFSGCVH